MHKPALKSDFRYYCAWKGKAYLYPITCTFLIKKYSLQLMASEGTDYVRLVDGCWQQNKLLEIRLLFIAQFLQE